MRPMGPIKRLLPTVVLVGAVLVAPLAANATAHDEWVFEGGGWGHGVGLSQYGALGQAQEGRSAEEILKFYYLGTSLSNMPNDHWIRQDDGLWVGLAANVQSVNLRAVGGDVDICQPADTCPPDLPYSNDFDDVTISPGESWVFEVNPEDSSECRFRKQGGTGQHLRYRPCAAALTKPDSTGVRYVVNGTEYARGTIMFAPSSNGFHVVVTLPLEDYLYGLAEVPSSWPAEALKAQAIIGRSYALATAVGRSNASGLPNATWYANCGCHLRNTAADQVYVGWSKEGAAWNGAVNNTNRQIVTHPQSTSAFNVATTYYSSSNGGWSENVEDVFGGTPRPWLKQVEDKWSANPNINPLANWSVKVSGTTLAASFGWDRVVDGQILTGPPGVQIRFTGKVGSTDVERVMTGWQVRNQVLGQLGYGFQPVLGGNTSVRVSPYITKVTSPVIFIDIIGNTFEMDINWLAEEDITRGCNPPENSRFCPDDFVTRGQMAAFLNRFLDLPAATENHFNDIGGNTFENDINRLAEAGITRGCNPPANTRFCPDDRVTREQMAAFIVRALELTENTHDGFGDVSSSNTFHGDIARLATAGITRGCNPPSNTNYCPKNFVTRGQMAAFLHRSDDFR